MSESVRIGFVGVGGRGGYLLKQMATLPGVEVVAIADTVPDNLATAKKVVVEAGQPEPKEYTKWSELLERDDIQGVVSALPVDLHLENYLATIAAGKDLYAEKPMCLTVKQCDELVAATEASDRIVQIGFQRRADPRFIEPMEAIWAGELGDLVEGRIAWSNSWGPLKGWFGQKERSGDWMVEQAVHNWDVMNWANRCLPKRAVGFGRGGLYKDQQPERTVTDYYSALVEYENGVIVNILHSWVAPGQPGAYTSAFNDEYTRLFGTVGAIDFNSGTFSYRKETGRPDRPAYSVTGEISNSKLALEDFVNSVQTRKPPRSGVKEGRDSVLACVLVREAISRGGVVTLEELQ